MPLGRLDGFWNALGIVIVPKFLKLRKQQDRASLSDWFSSGWWTKPGSNRSPPACEAGQSPPTCPPQQHFWNYFSGRSPSTHSDLYPISLRISKSCDSSGFGRRHFHRSAFLRHGNSALCAAGHFEIRKRLPSISHGLFALCAKCDINRRANNPE
jgi:hypothetical protein